MALHSLVKQTTISWAICSTPTAKNYPQEDRPEVSASYFVLSRRCILNLLCIGEGAFQALRGSAIGFGSDIGECSRMVALLPLNDRLQGGSVAMPAAFNHVYSFKPSHGRISFKGAANSVCQTKSQWTRDKADIHGFIHVVSRSEGDPYCCWDARSISCCLTQYVQSLALKRALAP